jgi:DNA polymerase
MDVPSRPTLSKLREAVQTCTACELHRGATQAVLGEGPAKARAMLVGEQPSDREGQPFVGPAGARGRQAGRARLPRSGRGAGPARQPGPRDQGSRPAIESDLAGFVTVTVHPSSILRAGDEREDAYREFVRDLANVAERIRV